MRPIICFIGAFTILTACSSINPWSQHNNSDKGNNAVASQEKALSPLQEDVASPQLSTLATGTAFQKHYRQKLQENMAGSTLSYTANIASKTINDYVRGIMQELVVSLQYNSASKSMAVTNFVYLDSDYTHSDLLGKQLAESFLHEIYKYGISVIDFKTTEYIRVTPEGDFVLSRDFSELTANLPIEYVLTGTLVKHQGGVLVNARIVAIESKKVVASAQEFLPDEVIDGLLKSKLKDGIMLIKQ